MKSTLAFQDGLLCPECGAVASRIGHEYTHADGTIGWQDDPVMLTKRRSGERFSLGEQGVVSVQVGEREHTVRGSTVTEPVMRAVMLVTHVCTSHLCCVAFPAHLGRRQR